MLVKPLVRPIVRAIAGRATDSLGSGFSPTSLFSAGEQADHKDITLENIIYWKGVAVGMDCGSYISWFPSAPLEAIEAR